MSLKTLFNDNDILSENKIPVKTTATSFFFFFQRPCLGNLLSSTNGKKIYNINLDLCFFSGNSEVYVFGNAPIFFFFFWKICNFLTSKMIYFKELGFFLRIEWEIAGISIIRQLCLMQCFNILQTDAPIWCFTSPSRRPHHAYYCLLFWETPCQAVCRVKCRDFTKRLYPTGPVPQQLWLIKRIRSTTGEKKRKKTCSLLPLDSQPTTSVFSLRHKRPTS